MEELLKFCPFCGGRGVLHKWKRHRGTDVKITFAIYCENDDCSECGCFGKTYFFETPERAIAAWNRRTPDVVRCGEYRYKDKNVCRLKWETGYGTFCVENDDYCSDGMRRGREDE